MTVRHLVPADLEAHCRVSSMAFHWNCKLEDETFPEHERLLGCFDGAGVLIADLEYQVRDATWGAATLPCVCVGGVASLPHHRRGGAVRRLFAELEAMAEQEGWALGALGPFRDGYYRQFGYERMSRCLHFETPMQALHDFAQAVPKEQLGSLELVEGEPLPEELLRVYNAYAAQVPLMLWRGQAHASRFHTKPLETCRYCMLWRSGAGVAEGYVKYHLDLSQRRLLVGELAFLTPEALRGLLCFLRGYASKADCVAFPALPWGSPLPLLLHEHTKNTCSFGVGVAVRVYHAEQALLHFAYTCDCEFSLGVVGDTLARNDASYHVASQAGKTQVERTRLPAAVTVTREALVLLLSGQIRDAMALRCCPGITVHDESAARDIVKAVQQGTLPLMWDDF